MHFQTPPIQACPGHRPGPGASLAASLEKALTATTEADNFNPIQVKDTQPTANEFTLTYISDGGPAVTLLDTVPAKFTNVTVEDAGACVGGPSVEGASRKPGKGATKLACELEAGVDATLVVTSALRSPGATSRAGRA